MVTCVSVSQVNPMTSASECKGSTGSRLGREQGTEKLRDATSIDDFAVTLLNRHVRCRLQFYLWERESAKGHRSRK